MQPSQQQLPLKDIHLPDSVSWWPPATGYWLVLLIIITTVIVFFILKTYLKKQRVKKTALIEYQRIKNEYTKNMDKKQLVTSLSELLRRAAISSYPRAECASLTGKKWLNWLDKGLIKSKSKSNITFSSGPGYLLTDFAYSKSDYSDDVNDLLTISHQWLKKLPSVNTSAEHQL